LTSLTWTKKISCVVQCLDNGGKTGSGYSTAVVGNAMLVFHLAAPRPIQLRRSDGFSAHPALCPADPKLTRPLHSFSWILLYEEYNDAFIHSQCSFVGDDV
jgi:hypothetical protein